MEKYKIKHQKSTPYHPQANGKVKSINKVLEAILTKTMYLHRKDWVEMIAEALWSYQTTYRNKIGHTSYEVVYGKKVLLPIEFHVETLRTIGKLGLDPSEAQKQRLAQLSELDELLQDVIQKTNIVHMQRS